MIRHRTADEAPHIVLEAAGIITGAELRSQFATLSDALDTVPKGFVLLAEYPDVIRIEDAAVGSLYYYFVRLFDARPSLAVFVSGGEEKHPGLRAFIQRIDTAGAFRLVDTREEADRLIAHHQEDRGRPDENSPPAP